MAEATQGPSSKTVSVLLVTDGGDPPDVQAGSNYKPHRARYTKSMLRSTLQLMGCKPRTAHKVSERVYRVLDEELNGAGRDLLLTSLSPLQDRLQRSKETGPAIALCRQEFEDLVISQLEAYTEKPAERQDFRNACSIQEQRSSVAVLLAGTSGTGKSTLAGLLAARLGITTVLSTDNIRHMLRSFAAEDQNPLLWASTYQAGDHIQSSETAAQDSTPSTSERGAQDSPPSTSYNSTTSESTARWDAKKRAVKGYKAQSEMVMESLDRLISSCAARHESLVCEGVHLSLNFVVQLMRRHPTIVPFLIYISNEDKHKERFAVRAKYMTLDPAANRYVKYIRNIRTIQDYLCRRADKHMIPKVDNTNVDRSVATIHATVLACLRHTSQGQPLLDAASMTTKTLASEYLTVKGSMWSSKSMLQIIRSKALANIAVSTTDSDYPSTSNSSPKGPLPVPERWNGDSGKAAFDLEETDPSDQEAGSTSSADNAAAPDPDVEETGSVDEDSVALEHDEETSVGSQDEEAAALEHDEEEASTAPGSGLMMSGGPALHGPV
ncbi:TPA: hypothetical protein ACH3X3_004049 [Trebouxia sp. C0006]